jgi:acyl carrier protein
MTEQIRPRSAQNVLDWLVTRISARLGIPAEDVSVDAYIDELDIDSADALVLVTELEQWLGYDLDITDVWRHPTLRELSDYLAREYLDVPRSIRR